MSESHEIVNSERNRDERLISLMRDIARLTIALSRTLPSQSSDANPTGEAATSEDVQMENELELVLQSTMRLIYAYRHRLPLRLERASRLIKEAIPVKTNVMMTELRTALRRDST